MTCYPEAGVAFGAVLDVALGNLEALAGRFESRRALGDGAPADSDLDLLLAAPSLDLRGIAATFTALYRDHRYDQALALVRSELARPDARRSDEYLLRAFEALLECATGSADAALRHAYALATVRPDDHAAHELVALSAIQLGRHELAMRHARRAVAGAPKHPELLETLGIVQRVSGDPERGAESLFEAAIARPDLPRARAELAAAFAQLGRLDEAGRVLDGLPPWALDDPFVRYARACLLAASGDPEAAREAIASAARIRPGLGAIARVDPILAPLFTAVATADPSTSQLLGAPAAGGAVIGA